MAPVSWSISTPLAKLNGRTTCHSGTSGLDTLSPGLTTFSPWYASATYNSPVSLLNLRPNGRPHSCSRPGS
uniref:Uncharacterized protein n=1 Tax=Arundo donax TaxID=35708 RepID=A0A0A9B6S6_ARUDO